MGRTIFFSFTLHTPGRLVTLFAQGKAAFIQSCKLNHYGECNYEKKG